MDMTLCKGEGCPIKSRCKRFNPKAESLYQSYFIDIPGKWEKDFINGKVWECDMFWGDTQSSILKMFENIMK